MMFTTTIAKLFKDKTEVSIFFIAFLVEMGFGLYLVQRWGFTFIGGDAITHLYIPRAVVDNGSFDFANIGTVFPPMFHLLVMPLVLIDALYTTGFAGTIVNALMTGGTCVLIYRLIGETKLGILASALFMFNAFTLIYGATPMMEQPAIFFLCLAVYYFKNYWEKDSLTDYMKCTLALLFGTLARYEVWGTAFLIFLFFVLRELKKRRFYRIAYSQFCFWGIFAWLFWNLAIFRDPLMFIHHPLSAQTLTTSNPPYYVGSILLTTNHVFQQLLIVSGFLCFFAILSVSISLLYKEYLKILQGMLLLSPLFFHGSLMFLNFGSVGATQFFYMPTAGLIILTFFFVRKLTNRLNSEWTKVILTALILLLLITTYFPKQLSTAVISSSEFTEFPVLFKYKTEIEAIKMEIGENAVLWDYTTTNSYSVLIGSSPSLIFDSYDSKPFYLKIMDRPWEYVPYVVIDKVSSDDYYLNRKNELYEGRYYLYRYYNDEAWKSEFLDHYKLILETEHGLVYKEYARGG